MAAVPRKPDTLAPLVLSPRQSSQIHLIPAWYSHATPCPRSPRPPLTPSFTYQETSPLAPRLGFDSRLGEDRSKQIHAKLERLRATQVTLRARMQQIQCVQDVFDQDMAEVRQALEFVVFGRDTKRAHIAAYLDHHSTVLQRMYRGYRVRKRVRQQRQAAASLRIQILVRQFLARCRVAAQRRRRNHEIAMEAHWRSYFKLSCLAHVELEWRRRQDAIATAKKRKYRELWRKAYIYASKFAAAAQNRKLVLRLRFRLAVRRIIADNRAAGMTKMGAVSLRVIAGGHKKKQMLATMERRVLEIQRARLAFERKQNGSPKRMLTVWSKTLHEASKSTLPKVLPLPTGSVASDEPAESIFLTQVMPKSINKVDSSIQCDKGHSQDHHHKARGDRNRTKPLPPVPYDLLVD
ncbi:hypothetical protein ACHHYP_15314 [Achlya hypogyna]|uniref:Uncharacterized protein n=1 Tax=Achlya hypogyna TaxID=1202772 RepID=A0A1V9YB64_ACHHY|nr:hypothetical protein ACHHYP_15314 [Achlya hypogyna]